MQMDKTISSGGIVTDQSVSEMFHFDFPKINLLLLVPASWQSVIASLWHIKGYFITSDMVVGPSIV